MNIVELRLDDIASPDWNPNVMDEGMRSHLVESITRFGLIVPLVARRTSGFGYETIGGAQRLSVLRELGIEPVPCVVVEADDAEARLLSQVLNRLHGDDDLGLKAESIRHILATMPQEEVLSTLPETKESLEALSMLGQIDLSHHLQAWQKAQSVRLRHLTLQLTQSQLEVVEEALSMAGQERTGENPNARGNAIFDICKIYIQKSGDDR